MFQIGLLHLILFFMPVSDKPVFESQIVDSNISIGYGLALADVDGDGKTDILLADRKQIVWYKNPEWQKYLIAENLTKHDNVCIAAADIDGDGKAEVAVGAQWNPSETGNAEESGAVFYLSRPADPTKPWKPWQLSHEPTVHRMRWVKSADGKYFLLVLPLHGRNNISGKGAGVKFLAYSVPQQKESDWPLYLLDSSLHMTHNFHHYISNDKTLKGIYIASAEGVRYISDTIPRRKWYAARLIPGLDHGAGEIKVGNASGGKVFISTVEPMHGNAIVLYHPANKMERLILDTNIKEGHALGVADFLGTGSDQVVAGWRAQNSNGETGIRIYYPADKSNTNWTTEWIDQNGMACEDIQVADLDKDGKPDIVASGRASKNVKIYWNRTAVRR